MPLRDSTNLHVGDGVQRCVRTTLDNRHKLSSAGVKVIHTVGVSTGPFKWTLVFNVSLNEGTGNTDSGALYGRFLVIPNKESTSRVIVTSSIPGAATPRQGSSAILLCCSSHRPQRRLLTKVSCSFSVA